MGYKNQTVKPAAAPPPARFAPRPGTNRGPAPVPRKDAPMPLDPYAPCPCGSGKKFKWCCQPIHVDIDRAYRQDAEGQHEAALKIMADLVAAHPSNPEAWGRQAHLLYQNNKVEEAEKALDKAFECNPEYPFGL